MAKKRKTHRGKSAIGSRNRRRIQLYTRIGAAVMIILVVVFGIMKIFGIGIFKDDKYMEKSGRGIDESRPDINVELLTVNPYSRPGTETGRINGIVIHYTANPGSTAMQNRDYFEGLKDSHTTKASSHFIVGLEGEIVQCVPTWEEAYASNTRNGDTVSIETCHMKENGKYTKETYDSLVELTAWLCRKFGLDETDVIRHHDITGKNCPKYFVEDEKAWKNFRKDVKKAVE